MVAGSFNRRDCEGKVSAFSLSYTVTRPFPVSSWLVLISLPHRYPYPPETYENVFAQLSAIVDGEAPGLPDDETPEEGTYGMLGADPSENGDGKRVGRKWSPEARDWVRQCLIKNADERATYPQLLVSTIFIWV
jgi:mitogen-activated protein kinase kinase